MGREQRLNQARKVHSASKPRRWIKGIVGFLLSAPLLMPILFTIFAVECYKKDKWPWQLAMEAIEE